MLFDRALAIERSDERLLDARCDHTPMLLPSCAALGHTAVSARGLLLPKLFPETVTSALNEAFGCRQE